MTHQWLNSKLGQVCQFRHGGTPSKACADYWGGDVPWVSPKDMKGSPIRSTEDRITRKAVEDAGAVLTPAGSILVVVRSGILVRSFPIALTAVETSFNQDLKAIRVNPSLALPEFVFRLPISSLGVSSWPLQG